MSLHVTVVFLYFFGQNKKNGRNYAMQFINENIKLEDMLTLDIQCESIGRQSDKCPFVTSSKDLICTFY